MRRQEALDRLMAHGEKLRALGVAWLALFGSVARDEQNVDGDVDLLVEFDRAVGLFHFFEVQRLLQRILGVSRVDLVMRDSVIEELKDIILQEAIPCLGDDGSSGSGTSSKP